MPDTSDDRIHLILQKLDALTAMVQSMKIYSYTYDPKAKENLASVMEKARLQFETMKKEAESELERDLKARALRGVGNAGDAVEDEDLKILDADYTRP